MKILGLAGVALLVSCAAAYGEEFDVGIGIGQTYGGIVGSQLSVNGDSNKFRIHAGIFGLGAGYERKISAKNTIGLTLAAHYPFGKLASLDWAYYPTGAFNDGFNFGLSLTKSKPTDGSIASIIPRYDNRDHEANGVDHSEVSGIGNGGDRNYHHLDTTRALSKG